MAAPVLTPTSTTSVSILPSTGSTTAVHAGCSFGIYTVPGTDFYSTDFISGAVDQVSYVYRKLGGDVLDIELVPNNVYAAYEESVLEYSYLLNLHQAKNVLSDVLGNSTGTFDHDGSLKSGSLRTSLSGTHINLKFPKFDFAYARRVADGISAEAGTGGSDTEYSASFDIEQDVQDYDLQVLISASANDASLGFAGLVGNKKILIKKVFYKSPQAGWRFYGMYGNGAAVMGNMGQYGFGQFADRTTFSLVPTWENRLQAITYEDSLYVRSSHYSYEIKNNKLRIYPKPSGYSVSKMWVRFTIPSDSWEEDTSSSVGVDGINNMNTLPFSNLSYESINAIGKQFIRRWALACCKETLGQIRGKFATVPIPNNEVTLNADALLSQAVEEKEKLREELKEYLEAMSYASLAKIDKEIVENTSEVVQKMPAGIFVG